MTNIRWMAAGVAALALLVLPGTASGQDGAGLGASVRGGLAVPVSDLADLAGAGPSLGASLRYRVHSRVALRIDGEVDLLSGLDAGGDRSATPDVELWRALAGVDVRVLPAESPLEVTASVGGGLTSYNTAVFPDIVFEPGTGAPVGDFAATYPTASGGLEVGYAATPSLEAFASGSWTVMLADEDETAIFGQLRPGTGGFDRASTVPVTAGVRLRF